MVTLTFGYEFIVRKVWSKHGKIKKVPLKRQLKFLNRGTNLVCVAGCTVRE